MYLINASDHYHQKANPTSNPQLHSNHKILSFDIVSIIKIEIRNEGNAEKRSRVTQHRQQKGRQRVAGNRFIGAQVQAKLYEQSYSSQ